VATGRSDFPNQINNVLAFPGVFRGALDVRARAVTEGMKLAAADALAALVGDDLTADYVIPDAFDDRVAPAVATAVAAQARAEGVARSQPGPGLASSVPWACEASGGSAAGVAGG
jgi:malate dehydrogenase (oxaloacetate-decarboxylating)